MEHTGHGNPRFSGACGNRILHLRVFPERNHARMAVGSLRVALVKMDVNGRDFSRLAL